jgi:hypothetical protein
MAGFRAQIGLPGGNDPGDIIVLGGDTSQVTFNMCCSEFTIMSIQGGGWSPFKTFKATQDPAHPWIFSSKVDLRLNPVDKGAYSKLPSDVQAAIKNLGPDTFSVQQLLFDLTNAQLSTIPTITGVALGSNEALLLDKFFLNGYFQTLRQKGEPVLGATITSNIHFTSTLKMTDFNFHTQTYQPVGPKSFDLDVLNYLCAVDGKKLPPASNFDWNWVTPQELLDHDGIVSINRNTFANWFRTQLASHARGNCWAFDASATVDGLNVQLKVMPSSNQTPTDNPSPAGAQVISYSYSHHSFDQAGINGALAKIGVDSSYNMAVTFANTAITITQRLLVTLNLEALASSTGATNVVDKMIVDTYAVGIDGGGKLQFKKTTSTTDHSQRQHIDGFRDLFLNYNAIVDHFSDALSRITSTNFVDIPVGQLQNFVFPGGRTFAFKKAAFSNNQDLVGLITYADPRTG